MDSNQGHSPVWNTLLGLAALLGLVTAMMIYHRDSLWPDQFNAANHSPEKHPDQHHDESVAIHDIDSIHTEGADDKEADQPNLQATFTEAANSQYHLIVGSFALKQNAEELKIQLIRKGYQAEIISANDSYRVSIFSNARYKEVTKQQSLLAGFESTWIVKQ